MKLRTAGLSLLLLALLALAASPASAGAAGAKLRIRAVKANDGVVTVRGRVEGSAAARRGGRVISKLTDGVHEAERRSTRIARTGRFTVRHRSALTGELTLTLRVKVRGRNSGRELKRKVTIAAAAPGPGPLRGTFRIEPGSAPTGAPPTGSWFQMLTGNGTPLQNLSSAAPNKKFTPLSPGTDGGLRTDAYQTPPDPAFAGGNSGDALAKRIIDPTRFYWIRFSIVTAPLDPQAKLPDPLPDIVLQPDGKLSGQLTAWAAQWNGQSFNQGTPKPDGTLPSPTTPLNGTYRTASRRYTLDWKSRIVGGPFNNFTGLWHLEGTFVPSG